MMKRLAVCASALTLTVFLLLASLFTAFAESTNEYAITDDASVFTDGQTRELAAQLKNAGEKTGWQFIVHTSNDGIVSDEDLESHYNDYYDRGYDANEFRYDAIMLVIDCGSNKRDILVYGEVRGYFKDKSRYDLIRNAMKPYLSSNDMYGATVQFIDKAVEIYGMGKTNMLVLSLKKYGWIGGLAGVIAGLIFFFANRSRYKNMGRAGTYDLSANSSVNLREVTDDFVTQHTTVRVIQRSSDSSSGGGGGGSHSGGGNSSGGF